MKKYGSTIQILSLGCACLIVAGSATPSGAANAPPNSGHLLVYRAAKFGYRLNLVLSVDGKDVASLSEGQTYDGYLPAGQHVLVASSYSQHQRCACGATNGDDTSWAHLLLHRSFVGKEFGVGKKKVTIRFYAP